MTCDFTCQEHEAGPDACQIKVGRRGAQKGRSCVEGLQSATMSNTTVRAGMSSTFVCVTYTPMCTPTHQQHDGPQVTEVGATLKAKKPTSGPLSLDGEPRCSPFSSTQGSIIQSVPASGFGDDGVPSVTNTRLGTFDSQKEFSSPLALAPLADHVTHADIYNVGGLRFAYTRNNHSGKTGKGMSPGEATQEFSAMGILAASFGDWIDPGTVALDIGASTCMRDSHFSKFTEFSQATCPTLICSSKC
eukprot:CAMPEP_0119507578 /NCGR_PEP_ID=MMETSP1344-20130328/27427_1 /TAXON_ID=236787 /ORGANISM="Florenciella parvula, Strain CCMP2471" /LENGTH=245 /DNA_ID=CAMNT_0007544223 /DNA_START=279 /DNA_END=1016 /DNA_ORIENTATION=+